MTTLALDISTKSTGYSVFENGELVTSGVISSKETDYIERGRQLANLVKAIAEAYQPTDLVVEDLKVIHNQKTLVMLGTVHGLIIGALPNIPVTYIGPTVWRAGFNHGLNAKRDLAKKRAIQFVEALYGLKVGDDEAEAILLGKFFEKNKNIC